jgi:glycosyltransferase involved in cell wall biosynthesis
VEIALRFPVTIVQLPAQWPLSAAAGRYVGLRHARGDLVLFVDGDYVLVPEWLAASILAFQNDPTVAAVCGRDVEELTGDSLLMRFAKQATESSIGEPEAIPIGLYRKDALESVGGIHPFLKGGEDRDLAHRLRSSGYRLLRIDQNMGIHRWAESGTLDFITYFRSVMAWSVGDGQALRARLHERQIRAEALRRYANVRHLANHLTGLTLLAVLCSNLLWVLRPELWPVLVADVAFVAGLVEIRKTKKWTWHEMAFQFHPILYSLLRQVGFTLGFLSTPRDPALYPSGELVLRRESVP